MSSRIRRAAVRAAVAVAAVVTLTGCGATSPAAPTETPSGLPAIAAPLPSAVIAPQLTAADIVAWAAEAEWSYAPDGLREPFPVQLTAGTATDDLSRSYELGDAVAGDVDGDGVIDAAIPIAQLDGNTVHELWYVWRGVGLDSDPLAEQVMYPIARTTRCGDVTRGVTAVAGGLQIDLVLRMPFTDDARSCADGGTGTLTRVIRLEQVDGVHYPVQTEPVAAWGGVCPPTEWLDGVHEMGISGRAAPPASAPVVTDPERNVALFALREAPLLTTAGQSFFGFIQGADEGAAVTMHCAFAD